MLLLEVVVEQILRIWVVLVVLVDLSLEQHQ